MRILENILQDIRIHEDAIELLKEELFDVSEFGKNKDDYLYECKSCNTTETLNLTHNQMYRFNDFGECKVCSSKMHRVIDTQNKDARGCVIPAPKVPRGFRDVLDGIQRNNPRGHLERNLQ